MPTSDPYWRGKELFLAALEKPSGERDAFLRGACAGDARLLDEISEMLAAHDRTSGGVMTHPTYDDASAPHHAEAPPGERAGDVIGPYTLLQQIGEGGMGTVFMAEQTHPVARKVALKIIKLGMDSRQVIARFAAEQHALALMEHPNIARVLDAGTTNSGRPFFVMELVKGVSITKYCDEQRLTPRQRLELFIPVCQAVQHAHQKGIIHRDLKPSNVLIALYDGKPVPKVIDFGVAKATAAKLTEGTLFTEFGQLLGTAEYMSPEQAGLNQLDIDTRTDIYSLGVLLYELLTGSTPLEHKRVKQAALLEVMRLVREEEAPRPSTRLSTTDQVASISANRGLEPKKLSGLVRGELDWIVMKAIEKDRNRRYESSSGFARDVERYLRDEAVEACPPSAAYRFRKFARRHKVALATASALALAVLLAVAGLVVNNRMVTREKEQTKREKERTEANFRLALDAVDRFFTQVSESRELKAQGLEGLRRDLLLTAKEFYEKFIKERSADRQLQAELGRAHMRLGFITDVLGAKREAIALYEQALPALDALARQQPKEPTYQFDLAENHNKLGQLFEATGQGEKAEAAYVKARAIVQRLTETYPAVVKYRRSLAVGHNNLASLYKDSGRIKEAEAAYAQSQRLMEALAKEQPEDPEILRGLSFSYYNWGIHYRETNRLKPAEAAFLEARKIQEILASKHPDMPECRRDLAGTYQELGVLYWISKQLEEADGAYRQSQAIRESLSLEHPLVAEYQSELAAVEGDVGNLYASTGRTNEALDAYAKSNAILEQLAQKHPEVLEYQNHLAIQLANLGIVYRNTGRPEEAENAYQKARAIFDGLIRRRPDVLEFANKLGNTDTNLGNLRLTTGKPQDSLEWYAKAILRLQGVLSQEPRHLLARQSLRNAYWGQSEALTELGRHTEALPARDRAVELDDQAEPTFRLGRIGTLLRVAQRERANSETEDVAKDATFGTVYDLACVYSLASKDALGGVAQADEDAARAVELLRRAIAKGHQDLAHLKDDKDLDTLRKRDDFTRLLAGLEHK